MVVIVNIRTADQIIVKTEYMIATVRITMLWITSANII
jgi:hypothetical protein